MYIVKREEDMKKTIMYMIGLIIFTSIATTVLAIANTYKIEAQLVGSVEELEAVQQVIVNIKFNKYNKIVNGINALNSK